MMVLKPRVALTELLHSANERVYIITAISGGASETKKWLAGV